MSISVSQKPFLLAKNRYFFILQCVHHEKVWQRVEFSIRIFSTFPLSPDFSETSFGTLSSRPKRCRNPFANRRTLIFGHFSTGSANFSLGVDFYHRLCRIARIFFLHRFLGPGTIFSKSMTKKAQKMTRRRISCMIPDSWARMQGARPAWSWGPHGWGPRGYTA